MRLKAEVSEQVSFSALSDLASRVTAITGIDAGEYAKSKIQLLNTIGYEQGSHKFTFSTALLVSDVIDAFLGA